jgi:Dehydrogenases with different specificities (related to short-chain alcohol dehydrogenases)
MAMLQDKVIAVTGAGRGIGREVALLCARSGASVVVNDYGGSAAGEQTGETPAQDVVDEIISFGGKAIVNEASISDPAGAASIVEDAVRVYGRIDAVVNNAGFVRDAIFHKMSIENWKAVIDVHLNGYFYVSIAAARYFREQGSGAFVHFTSTSGLIGNFGQANYSAAKMGVVGLSNSIALDMGRFGVTSNCIAPFAWSRMTAAIPETTEAERLRVERFKTMSPAQVAPLAACLCADAAHQITGQIFSVRKNEIFLFDRPMPIRGLHRSDGWTIETIASDLLPALQPSMQKLQRSTEVFSWDPV